MSSTNRNAEQRAGSILNVCPGCRRTHPGRGRCHDCETRALKVYRSQLWRHARARALNRDDFRCVRCGASHNLDVHHRQPIGRDGDPFALSNLETLCRSCHLVER